MNHPIDGDNSVIKELLNPDLDLLKEIVDPFKKELNLNLLARETSKGKEDLIAFYIYEFVDMQFIFNQHKEILFSGTRSYNTPDYKGISYTSVEGVTRILSRMEVYYIECQELFDFIFDEIQRCCMKYKIDFIRICKDLKFDLDYIDHEITSYYNESENISEEDSAETPKTKSDINDFFNLVKAGEISQLEIFNRAQFLTDNFDLNKLCLLEEDFYHYFFKLKENKRAEYSIADISAAIEKCKISGKAIPYIKLPTRKTKNGEIKEEDIVDYEKLLYPNDFFYCYQFRNFLKRELENRNTQNEELQLNKSDNFSIPGDYFEYIDLHKNSSKLTDFFDKLKKHHFIHTDTKAANFKKIFSGKPVEGIMWTGTATELKHLFKLLYTDHKKLKKVSDSHWKIMCNYFVDNMGNKFEYKKFRNLKLPQPQIAVRLEKMVKDL